MKIIIMGIYLVSIIIISNNDKNNRNNSREEIEIEIGHSTAVVFW